MQDDDILIETDPENRTIIYGGDITPKFAVRFTSSFLGLCRSDGNINLVCVGSEGGDWDTAGLGLVDLIANSEQNITTYALGANCSSQAILFCVGDDRIIGPEAYLMFHDGFLDMPEDSQKSAEKLIEINKMLCDRTHIMLGGISNRPPSHFKDKMSDDYYVMAEQALEMGLATEIGTIMGIA